MNAVSEHRLRDAHRFCTGNGSLLGSTQKCACLYCGIDSVIGEAGGYPLAAEFVEAMHRYWFSE